MLRSLRVLTLGAALVAALLLGACTSNDPADSPPSPAPAEPPATAVTLDTDTAAWFTAYCSGLAPGLEFATRKPSEGRSASRQKSDVSRGVQSLRAALDATGETLSKLPPPGEPGLRQWAAQVPTAMKTAATRLVPSLQAYDATNVKDRTRFRQAEAKLAADLGSMLKPIVMPAQYATAPVVRKLPACRPFTGERE